MSKDETVIVIRSLVPGGVAAWDGRILPGDRLMFVNSVDLSHASLDEAVQVNTYFSIHYSIKNNSEFLFLWLSSGKL